MLRPSSHIIQLINKSFSANNNSCILTYYCEDIFEFQNGQFLQYQLRINDTIVKRSYSIMSSFAHLQHTNQLQILVKRVADGIWSNWLLNEHTLWESIEVIWPLWHLVPQPHFHEYLLVGTWSGIAPLISIYSWLPNDTPKQIIRWERTSPELLPEIIEHIGKENITLSQEQTSHYQFGHVQDLLQTKMNIFTINEHLWVYLCGKPSMVDDVKQRLINQWVPTHNIKDEKY